MKADPVHRALSELAKKLDQQGIGYAIAGAMALGYHGFVRVTQDIDVIMTDEDLTKFQEAFIGQGYLPAFSGARKHYKDTVNGVRIDVLVTGEYPGDGKPKPVVFPDPEGSHQIIDGVKVLTLTKLIDLKLASGLSAPHRISDLGDVQKLIEAVSLPRELAQSLDASVRAEYTRLWDATQKAKEENLGPDRE
jgi:hypothetical protein